ncbi:MAG: hypothetical protein V8Q79_10055 [Christensenellales bacterium]
MNTPISPMAGKPLANKNTQMSATHRMDMHATARKTYSMTFSRRTRFL